MSADELSVVLVAVPAATSLSAMPPTVQRIIGYFLHAEGGQSYNIQTHDHVDNGQEMKGMVIRYSKPEDVEFLFQHPLIVQSGWEYLAGQKFNIETDTGGQIIGVHKALSIADCLRFQSDVTQPADDINGTPITRRPTEQEVIAPVVVSGASPMTINSAEYQALGL